MGYMRLSQSKRTHINFTPRLTRSLVEGKVYPTDPIQLIRKCDQVINHGYKFSLCICLILFVYQPDNVL